MNGILYANAKSSGAATTDIIAAVAGKVLAVRKVTITGSAASTVKIQDDTTTQLSALHEIVAGVPLVLEYTDGRKTGAGKKLQGVNSAGNVAYEVEYWTEP